MRLAGRNQSGALTQSIIPFLLSPEISVQSTPPLFPAADSTVKDSERRRRVCKSPEVHNRVCKSSRVFARLWVCVATIATLPELSLLCRPFLSRTNLESSPELDINLPDVKSQIISLNNPGIFEANQVKVNC
ncbi:hypothetical protein Ahy_A02g009552 [Arachis hypogaea]|uniref:Uncharacterized protein n=1 Tax=Arachis hypogaea TaxID=3818 RepID=A0A445EHF6_ARAHY|nr:hypothetical protein Ahy_A02g009552 [Arachis hypogaea]